MQKNRSAALIVLLTQAGNATAALGAVLLAHAARSFRNANNTTANTISGDSAAQAQRRLGARLLSATLLFALLLAVALGCGGWRVRTAQHSPVVLAGAVAGGVAGCAAVLLAYPLSAPLRPAATAAFSTGMG